MYESTWLLAHVDTMKKKHHLLQGFGCFFTILYNFISVYTRCIPHPGGYNTTKPPGRGRGHDAFSAVKVKSTTDTSGVGTRKAIPVLVEHGGNQKYWDFGWKTKGNRDLAS